MKLDFIKKMESPERLKALDIQNTIDKMRLKKGDIVCDFGAGTGTFTFAIAKNKDINIKAVEIDESLIEFMKTKKVANVEVINGVQNVANASCDVMLISTVLHHIHKDNEILKAINNKIKENGKLFIIEFVKRKTKIGPTIKHRISKKTVMKTINNSGFRFIKRWKNSDSLYTMEFRKNYHW